MAFTTNTVNFGSGDLASEQQQLTRQQQLAQALAQQAQAPLESAPTPAGGLAVPIGKGQIYGKIAQALASAYINNQVGNKEKEFNQEKQSRIAEALGNYDQMRSGTPEKSIDIFGATPDQPTQGTMPGVAPDPRGAALGLIGSGVPELQQFGMQSFMAQKGPESMFGKIDPKDYTQKSVARFAQSNNFADLEPVRKNEFLNVGGGHVAVNPYATQPGQMIQNTGDPYKDLVVRDEQGNIVQNSPLVQARKDIGKAGATNVQVKTDVKTGESLASQVGPMMKESTLAAEGAVKQAQAADQILGALSGPAYTGPGADIRLKAAQIADTLGVGGKDTADKISNTRTALQNLSQLTLQGRQQMRGQGAITEGESALAQRAVSGDIDLTANEIKQLANAAKRAAAFQYQEHQRKLQVMQSNPNLSGIAPFYQGPAMQDSAPAQQATPQPVQAPAKRLVYDPATGSFR